MANFTTKNWVIGILIGAWIATFVVGYLHEAKMLYESKNPIIHTFMDWILLIVLLLPITYVLARIMPSK